MSLDLLDAAARGACGQPHDGGVAARRLLLAEGFCDIGSVDLLEGGPNLVAGTDAIRTVRDSRTDILTGWGEPTTPALLSHGIGPSFRAWLGAVWFDPGGLRVGGGQWPRRPAWCLATGCAMPQPDPCGPSLPKAMPVVSVRHRARATKGRARSWGCGRWAARSIETRRGHAVSTAAAMRRRASATALAVAAAAMASPAKTVAAPVRSSWAPTSPEPIDAAA